MARGPVAYVSWCGSMMGMGGETDVVGVGE